MTMKRKMTNKSKGILIGVAIVGGFAAKYISELMTVPPTTTNTIAVETSTNNTSEYDSGVAFEDIQSDPSAYRGETITVEGIVLDIQEDEISNSILLVVDNDVNKLMTVHYDEDLLSYDLSEGAKITTEVQIGVEKIYTYRDSNYSTIGAYANKMEEIF